MRRTAVLGAALTVLLAPATSHAKTVCNLLTDKAADTGIAAQGTSPVRSPAHDITSVDVATGKKTLVAVMRVTTTAVADDPAAKTGMYWRLDFKIGKISYMFKRTASAAGTFTDTAAQDGAAIAGLTAKMDGKTITWTVPRANIAGLKGKKPVLSALFAGTASSGLAHDYAPDSASPSTVTYADRTPSCLRPA